MIICLEDKCNRKPGVSLFCPCRKHRLSCDGPLLSDLHDISLFIRRADHDSRQGIDHISRFPGLFAHLLFLSFSRSPAAGAFPHILRAETPSHIFTQRCPLTFLRRDSPSGSYCWSAPTRVGTSCFFLDTTPFSMISSVSSGRAGGSGFRARPPRPGLTDRRMRWRRRSAAPP